jgi:D-alanyl-D-alanine carboxypeptidase
MPEARPDSLPPPPPGSRPGVLGVLPAKEVGKDETRDAPVRTVTASIAPVAPAPLPPAREIPAKPAAVAAAPVAAPAKVETRTMSNSRPRSGWIVQVGAFEDVAEAKEKLAAARAKAGSLLKDAEAYTEPFSKGDKRYFRARFAGLKENSAELACKELQKSGNRFSDRIMPKTEIPARGSRCGRVRKAFGVINDGV